KKKTKISFFNYSNRDFLLQTRSKFFVDKQYTHKEILGYYLTIIDTKLRKNIYYLKSYRTRRTKISSALISQYLQPELYYSYHY
ncbi:hypothetical protein N7528_009188, partial [Penicillium herquei]